MKKQPPVIDIFQDAIGNISDRQTQAARHFWYNVAEATRVFGSQDKIETTTMYKVFLNVIREGKLLSEIGGILDELHVMLQIQDQQDRVFKSFSKHLARLLLASKSRLDGPRDRRGSTAGTRIRLGDGGILVDPADPAATDTMSHVKELEENLKDHITDLNGLEETAVQIKDSLERLVDLKLQQAGVIQAQEASEEALKQGRSIMLFTVITIIFLPLSFVASVFGMSTAATDYRDGLMTFGQEFLYMVPTSLAFALLVLIIALSATVRGILIYSLQLPWIYFATSTNLDLAWECLVPKGNGGRSLVERAKRRINDVRREANVKRGRKNAYVRRTKEKMRRLEAIEVEVMERLGAPVRVDTEGVRDGGVGEVVEVEVRDGEKGGRYLDIV
ncbi:hypothetical protein BGZ57DRAFT_979616 [Hyaloscypha finlandica]|nr:hypothetical protein BGZ57DRAFT_979616 [Hyaloscypha finlandica]